MSDKAYKCPECGLHYDDEEIMKKCQAFCAEYHACSIEITKHSLEAKQETQK